MISIARRLRSLLIAVVVLALSATAVFAGRSAVSAPTANVASQQVPAGQDVEEDGDEDELDEPENEPADEDLDQDEDAPDADVESAEHPDNHGKLVSEAAQADTPAEFDNHGAYVRTIAKDNHGHSSEAATERAAKKNR